MATITEKDISDYTPDPENANKGTERGVYALDTSLEQFGAGRSVLADKDGVLIAGNKTMERAAEHGFKKVIEIETDGTELVVVKRKDLSLAEDEDNRARGLAYADNRVGQLGLEWDAEQLLADAQKGVDLLQFWKPEELEELLGELRDEPPGDPGAAMDRAAELQEKWQVERGQIWQVGRHRVMCGDSTNGEDVGRLMDGGRALLMATDPPYGDSWVQKARDMQERGYGHSRAGNRAEIESDDLSDSEFDSFLDSWLSIAKEVALKPPASVYVWHRARRIQFEVAISRNGFHVHQPIIWVKPSFVIGRLDYHPRCEWALHGWLKGNGRGVFFGERNQSDVWEVSREGGESHPTQKPLELWERPIRNHLRSGEVLYDPFLGSGTAIVAAEHCAVIGRGMELMPEYVAITLERLSGMGLEPHLLQ